ncbi:hypothetical protein N9S30_00555 [bacterium]|nr:hypothetical protein [bacterium]
MLYELPAELIKRIAACHALSTLRLMGVCCEFRQMLSRDTKQCFLKLCLFLQGSKWRNEFFHARLDGKDFAECAVAATPSDRFVNGECLIRLNTLISDVLSNFARYSELDPDEKVTRSLKGAAMTLLLRACFDETKLDEHSRVPWLKMRRIDGRGDVVYSPQACTVDLTAARWLWHMVTDLYFRRHSQFGWTTEALVSVTFPMPQQHLREHRVSTHTVIKFAVRLGFLRQDDDPCIVVSKPLLTEFKMSTFKWH